MISKREESLLYARHSCTVAPAGTRAPNRPLTRAGRAPPHRRHQRRVGATRQQYRDAINTLVWNPVWHGVPLDAPSQPMPPPGPSRIAFAAVETATGQLFSCRKVKPQPSAVAAAEKSWTSS